MHLCALGVHADALNRSAGARQANRAVERPRVADRVDAHVHASTFGGAAHGRANVISSRCSGCAPKDAATLRRSGT